MPWNRFEIHSWLPSGETVAISGEPPASQVSTTVLLARSMTEIVFSRRLVTNSRLASRLKANACAPVEVGMKPTASMASASMTSIPCVPWLAT